MLDVSKAEITTNIPPPTDVLHFTKLDLATAAPIGLFRKAVPMKKPVWFTVNKVINTVKNAICPLG